MSDGDMVLYALAAPFILFGATALMASLVPIIAPILAGVIIVIHTVLSLFQKPEVIYETKTVYKDRIVYRDKPVEAEVVKEPTQTTSSDIIEEVVSALKSLGIPNKSGKKIASELGSKKTYTKAEDLLKDCLASL
jgi:hypothetical protein